MSQFRLLVLAAFVAIPLGCGQQVEVAEASKAPAVDLPTTPAPPKRPFQPPEKVLATTATKAEQEEDKSLTNEDIGLDSKTEAALSGIDKITIDVLTPDNVGVPGIDTGALNGGSSNGGPLMAFEGRTGATKSRLIREGGGNEVSERAVARGLAWLAEQQKADGSWEFDAGAWKDDRIAATGLALLPFLGAGQTHKTRAGEEAGKYADTVKKGLEFLKKACVTSGAKVGQFEGATTATSQAIAALALSEAYGLTRDATGLHRHAQMALNAIQKSQSADGGWSDKPDDKSDTGVTGWHIKAIQSAKLAKGLVVNDQVIKKAIPFLNAVSAGSRKSMYGTNDNTDAKPGTAATASGLLSRYYIDGWGPNHPGTIDGLGGLVKNSPKGTGAISDLRYFYEATQIVRFCEGEEWKTWNEGPKDAKTGVRKGGMRDWLTDAQTVKAGPEFGSWDTEKGAIGENTGRLGTTAFAVLTLEVYYRHLLLYKRGASGKAEALIDEDEPKRPAPEDDPPPKKGKDFSLPFDGRVGEAKTRLIKDGGGNEASEVAVARGLAWLAKQQKADGGWEFDQGNHKAERVAATGFALLAFLGTGETHKPAKGDAGRYKDTVNKGLEFLKKNCPPAGMKAGKMSDNMYTQAIGTIPLCEAYGMTKDAALLPHAQAAINFIQKAQAHNGSWGYSPVALGDTSIVGWQIQALHAAKQAKGLIVNDNVIKKAVGFLNLAGGGKNKAMYGYADAAGARPGTALTAVGLLSRERIDGWGPDHAGMVDGLGGLAKNGPRGKGEVGDMYYYYYATQVVHFGEGEEWKNWNEGPKDAATGARKGGMRDWLVNTQITKAGPNLGSWDPEAGIIGNECGRVGTTALCLLTLEVYYRSTPAVKPAADK